MAAHSADLHIRADEPSADGHFPGNPIVPGAVLLREVLRILTRDRDAPGGDAPGGEAPDGDTPDGDTMCCDICAARFFHPVRPGDRLTLRWDAPAGGDISFTCAIGTDERRVLSGAIRMRAR